MLLGAGPAGAVAVQGKWGIGAGLFGGGGELALIRGKSERSAWLFEFRLDGERRDAASDYEAKFFSVAAGPGFRRFARPKSEFSPYYDVTLVGLYSRVYSGFSSSTGYGAQASLDFGLEYFTRWHFSVAGHTSVVNARWARSRSGGPHSTTTLANIGIYPALFVRGYW
jgi:hypothetical protein